MAIDLAKYKLKATSTAPAGKGAIDLQKYRLPSQPKAVTVPPEIAPKPGLVQRVQEGVKTAEAGRAKNLGEIADARSSGEQGFVRSAFQTGGELIGAAIDPIVETVKQATPNFIKKPLSFLLKKTVGAGVNAAADRLSETPLFKEAAASSPNPLPIERDIQAGNEYLNLLPGPKGVKAVTSGVTEVLPKVADTVVNTARQLTTRSEQQIESAVVKRFEKGVKPLLPGKTTPSQVSAYRDDIVTAVKTIRANKDALSFADAVEGTVSGQTPKTLQQLSEALEQTKKAVFTQYDSLAKQAGDAGVKIELSPISTELDTVINNKALSITNPRAIQYARQLKDRLTRTGALDAKTAQEVIQNYNKSLEAFYRNPTYDTASQAAIDAMVANRMRQTLDEGISGLTGAQYQTLKNQYGSLKAIERDVIKASLRDARKNVKGLIDLTDIFSGGQVVGGILSLNPTTIASGLTQKAIAAFYKHLNDPNRAIERMFKAADELPSVLPREKLPVQ